MPDMPKYRIKAWFPDRTNRVLMASDDFPKMREFAAKLRSLFMSCPQDVERFQWELVDDRNRVALDLVEPIRWSEPIAPEDDFFAPRGRS